MATFFILPPRECLEQAMADFAARFVPGLTAPASVGEAWLEALTHANGGPAECILLHREDLAGGDVVAELVESFGAEPGDAVREIGLGSATRAAAVRCGRIDAAVSSR